MICIHGLFSPHHVTLTNATSWVAARYALRLGNTAVVHTLVSQEGTKNADQDLLTFSITRIFAILASQREVWRVCQCLWAGEPEKESYYTKVSRWVAAWRALSKAMRESAQRNDIIG
jgi:hypothetical protein